MDTFNTNEEVISEIDIQATEVDFGENFEFGVNDQEHENNNEQEAGIGEENGEKNIEDEKLEEKEQTLSDFISANRGGSEEFKLEYEGTFVLSILTEEQKSAHADLLTSLSANPEQALMLPDHIDGKTTYFTAAKMDSEGNLKYEIRSFTEKEEEKEEKPIDKVEEAKLEEATLNLELNIDINKQEDVDKETLIGQSLLTEVEAVSEEEVEQAQEITQTEEYSFSIPEVQHADVEQVMSLEEAQSRLTPVGEYASIDNANYSEQVAVEAKDDTEKAVTERIIDLLREEPQAKFIEEESTVIGITETEQNSKNTQEYNTEGSTINSEPLVAAIEDKTDEVLTLEERIRELFRDEVETTEIVPEQVQTFEAQNARQEEVVTDVNKITEINTTTERSAISNEQVEQIVADVEAEVVEGQVEIHGTVQASHIENIQQQKIEVEQTFSPEKIEVNTVGEKPKEAIIVNKQESKIPSTKEVNKLVTANQEKVVAKNQEERTLKSSREAIVLTINKSEVPISLEKPKEEQRAREEITKDKHPSGHEILLQILGISQNGAEVRNAEPTNSRSVPNINQEEQETKSAKSVPSMYQQRNLNGITLKIAA